MLSEREETIERMHAAFHEATGILLPTPLCGVCESQLCNLLTGLETLDELLGKGLHPCLHYLAVITVFHGVINGDDRLRDRLRKGLSGPLGWNDFHERLPWER